MKQTNVSEHRRDNPEWTIQRHWEHWVQKTQDKDKQDTKNTTQKTKKDEQHGPHQTPTGMFAKGKQVMPLL